MPVHLAADTGMRPQEYVVLPHYNVLDTAVMPQRTAAFLYKTEVQARTSAFIEFRLLDP
jgi:hypothetical protein